MSTCQPLDKRMSAGRTHYESVVKIDFIKMKNAVRLFEDVEDDSEIISRISAFTSKPLIEGKTLIFLDEVQKCPEAVIQLPRGGAGRRAG